MNDSVRSKRSFDWTLEPEMFGHFLARLDPDLRVAAKRYETLRARLLRLFEWRGCDFAEDLADEAIDRVIKRTNEGVDLHGEELLRYAGGVARHIVLEYWRERQREQVSPGDADQPPFVPGKHSTTDLRLTHLEECLQRLGESERSIILRYYHDDRGQRIHNRKELAKELGVEANTLRIRAFRIRAKLFESVQQVMEAPQRSTEIQP